MKYIVSACLAGEKCRYDGNANTDPALKKLVDTGQAIPVCPEILGGLTCPRPRCEIMITADTQFRVIGEDGKDYTDAFLNGAIKALKIAEEYGVTDAVLKSKSPSCGCGLVYDGTFSGKLVEGNGLTAELFLQSGIYVLNEDNFTQTPD